MPDWRSFSQLVCMSLCWIFEIIWMCLARVIERSYRGFTVAYRPVRLLAAVKFMPELESNQQQVYTEICCHICVGKHMPFFSCTSEVLHWAQVSRFHEHDDLFLEMMQLQSKGFIKIHYDLVVVGNLEKEQSWWTQSPPSRNWQISKFFCFSARKTQKKRGRKLLLGSEVSEDRQLAPQFVTLVVLLSKENNNNQDQQGIKMDVSTCFTHPRWCHVKAGRISSGHRVW